MKLIKRPTMGTNQQQNESQNSDYSAHNFLADAQDLQQAQRSEDMSNQDKFCLAKEHLQDALEYRTYRPRLTLPLYKNTCYRVLHTIFKSYLLTLFFQVASFVFMYLIILDQKDYALKIGLESSFLFLFWLEMAVNSYLKVQDSFHTLPDLLCQLKWKLALLTLYTLDLIIFGCQVRTSQGRLILPFRFLRGFLPMIYNYEIRVSFRCLRSASFDIIAFLAFYWIFLVLYSLVGTQALNVDASLPHDEYTEDYTDMKRMIFIMYINASTDAYPDNNFFAIRQSTWNYAYFVLFTFLNFFIFSVIPGSLVYYTFRETKIKLTLQAQLKQQKSLAIAFRIIMDQGNSLSLGNFIDFLFDLYQKKPRYFEHITQITLETCNNSSSIYINEFIHLGKIILNNQKRLPPKFYDWQCWVSLKECFDRWISLTEIISHWLFEFVVSLLIIASVVVTIALGDKDPGLSNLLNFIFLGIFFVQIVLRVISMTLPTFFDDIWNIVDTFIVVIDILLTALLPTGSTSILRVVRVFRIINLLRVISYTRAFQSFSNPVLSKLSQLLKFMTIVIPIISRYFWILLIIYYWYSIICMEIFYDTYQRYQQTSFSKYDWTAHFRSFINSQFVMVQILIDAGWSVIVIDLSSQNQRFYGIMMFMFCLMHMTIVFIIAGLIKGIFWEIYLAVSKEYLRQELVFDQEQAQVQERQRKKEEIVSINQQINQNVAFQPNTVLKRKFFETFIDKKLLLKLMKKLQRTSGEVSPTIKPKWQRKIEPKTPMSSSLDKLVDLVSLQSRQQLRQIPMKTSVEQLRSMIMDSNALDDCGIDYVGIITDSMVDLGDSNVSFEPNRPSNPLTFLSSRIERPSFHHSTNQYFEMDKDVIHNSQSIRYHMDQMKALLGIESFKHNKKQEILKLLVEEGLLTKENLQNINREKVLRRNFQVDTTGIIRKTFLAEISEEIIRKAQTEFFGQKYGKKFNRLSRITLQPLLMLNSNLASTLRNILRYPKINTHQFFEVLNKIEDLMSNKLFRKGSLFKFIFELEDGRNSWCTIEYKGVDELRIHFLKSGVWIYNESQEFEEIYHIKDLFHIPFEGNNETRKRVDCLAKLFENFEGMALSLIDQKDFFETNPKYHTYDLYFHTQDTTRVHRYTNRRVEVSKIMLAVLTLEHQRKENQILPYDLTSIEQDSPKKSLNIQQFLENNRKLKNISNRTQEQIIETEGLPYAYTVNLMEEITEITSHHLKNFVYQVERALNMELDKMSIESKPGQ